MWMLRKSHSPTELVTYALWSQNRRGEVQGVYSHETALAHYELTDLNPSKLHMTVPKGFRRNSELPGILDLHMLFACVIQFRTPSGYLTYTTTSLKQGGPE